MKLGIIGLPISGKTTVFNALTGAHKKTGVYTSSSADAPNIAMVKIQDDRMSFLKKIYNPEKLTLADIEYVDIIGIFSGTGYSKEASTDSNVQHSKKGHHAGKYNPMSFLREMDAIIQVIRVFKDEGIPLMKGTLNPKRDLNEINSELIIADLGIVEKRIEKIKKSTNKPKKEQQQEKEELRILSLCKDALENGKDIKNLQLGEEEKKIVKGFCFLTEKPRITVLNIGEDQISEIPLMSKEFSGVSEEIICMCAQVEMEIMDLEPEERQEFIRELGIGELASKTLIELSCKVLNTCSFFTVLGNEVRAWTIYRGTNAVTAAGKVHTDMARGFIKAEVVHFKDFQELGSMKELRARGMVKLEGKDHIVQDGDIVMFRFNV